MSAAPAAIAAARRSPGLIAFDHAFPLPRFALSEAASPLQPLPGLAAAAGGRPLMVKRDDRYAPEIGGSKARALEYLLAPCQDLGTDAVVCSGLAGSSYVAATARASRRLGRACSAVVGPQPLSADTRRNVRAAAAAGCRIVALPTGVSLRSTGPAVQAEAAARRAAGARPLVLPFGGMHPLASLAYMRAMVELADQLTMQGLPPPERIYAVLASGCLAAGLAAGIAWTGLPARLVAVQVARGERAGPPGLLAAHGELRSFLAGHRLGHGPLAWSLDLVEVVDGTGGLPFGAPTPAGEAATAVFATAGVALEACYTAKAAAHLLADAGGAKPGAAARPWLLWQSANGGDDLAA